MLLGEITAVYKNCNEKNKCRSQPKYCVGERQISKRGNRPYMYSQERFIWLNKLNHINGLINVG